MKKHRLIAPLGELGHMTESSDPTLFSELIQELPIMEDIALQICFEAQPGVHVWAVNVTILDGDYILVSEAGAATKLVLAKSDSKIPKWENIPDSDPWTPRMVQTFMYFTTLFVEHMRKAKKYPFLANSITDYTKIKNPAKRAKLEAMSNTVVYLDKPPQAPTKGKKAVNKRGPLQFGYPRARYRKTLSANCYRNHPKYKVYKGVEVSQSWAGPEEYRDGTRTYKLMMNMGDI